MRGYAESQSETPAIDSSYLGVAVQHDSAQIDFYLDSAGEGLIISAYIVPFCIVFIALLTTFFIVWCNTSLEDLEKSIKSSPPFQANIVAAVLLCGVMTVFTFGLDVKSCVVDFSEPLPPYYDRRTEAVIFTIFSVIIYFPVLLFGIFLILSESCLLVHSWRKEKGEHDQATAEEGGHDQAAAEEGEHDQATAEEGEHDQAAAEEGEHDQAAAEEGEHDQATAEEGEDDQAAVKKQKKSLCKTKFDMFKSKFKATCCQYNEGHRERIVLSCVLIAGSAILSLTAHFPSILMAWATDPFYASQVALFYGIIIFSYFTTFHYSYTVSSRAFGEKENGEVKFTKKLCVLVPISLFVTFIAVFTVICLIAVFVVTVPVSNSIETATEGVTSIYNGAIVLIGGLLAYRIGWHYIGQSFSVSDALEKALEKMDYPLPQENKLPDKEKWEELTEEGRLTEVIKAMISSELKKINA